MKRSIFLCYSAIIFIGCIAATCSSKEKEKQEKEENTETIAVFDSETHDFGKITAANGKVECKFTFTNKGKKPLVITDVRPTCGCTAPEWTKEPIAPGKQGFIQIVYDPTGNSGTISKNLTVFYNGNPPTIRLKIQAEVE